ncbi:MAG TPA: hypothetical protein VFO42_04000 [Sphingomicrobium sp.]|nr:hypothetical protein [Sphingomicrobium sp.]
MKSLRTLGKALAALLALIGAGTVAADASAPPGDGWRADPDEQFMLDVSLRRLKLGDGVRAYVTPSGPCLVFGDFLTALDMPMKIDLEAGRASGWAFSEKNQVVIDKDQGSASFNGKRESFAINVIRDTPEGWCVAADALEKWFSLSLSAKTGISLLEVGSEAKLPVELAVERRLRAAQLKRKASIETADLPRVRLPYRLWRAPALEFMVNAGATYSAGNGLRLDRSVAIAGAGEVAAMSYSFRVSGNGQRPIETVRAKLYRSDPEAQLLGPLKATHFAVGDVEGVRSDFGGGNAVGRGVVVTNEPLNHRSNFDRTAFSGELPPGWDAELYRNDSLVAFADSATGDGLYRFDDVELLYGENRFEILLYGPQGQVQRRVETVAVGQENVPRGQLWYWAGVRQPNTPLLSFDKPAATADGLLADARTPSKAPELAFEARYGVSKRLSVGALVRSLEVQDERLSYVEGSLRYSIGRALGEIAAARDNRGGTALRAQLATKIGSVNINAATQWSNGFAASTDEAGTAIKAEHRIGLNLPVKLGDVTVPVSGDVKLVERIDGSRELDAAARLSSRIGRFNLTGETTIRRQLGETGDSSRAGERVDAALIASGYVGRVRLRGGASWKIEPERRFDRAEINAFWSAGETTDLEAGIAYTADNRRLRGRVGYIKRLDSLALAVTGEAASDGSLAAGISVNFAMDPFRGHWRPTRQKLATTGLVKARVFEDLNENGRRDSGEPAAADAFVTTGLKLADRPTGKDGTVLIGGLAPYVPVAVGIDQSSLANPALTPSRPAQVVVPRPGVDAAVDIALVGGGSVEGFAAKEDGSEYEGLELQLVAPDGEIVATTISDIDGYFLFERVRYGSYRLRLAPTTAKAIPANADLGVTIAIDRDRPLGRIGVVRVTRAASLASAAPAGDLPKSSGTTLP